MNWFYANDKEEQVSTTEEELRRLAASGALRPDTLIWREGMADWTAVSTAKPEWFSPRPAASVGDGSMPLTLPPMAAYQTPTHYGPPAGVLPVTDGLATASLVCGLVGVFLGACYGMGIFASIAAIIMGHISLGNIKRSGNVLQGRGLAIAGLILGYLIVGLIAVVVAIFGIALFVGIAGAAAGA